MIPLEPGKLAAGQIHNGSAALFADREHDQRGKASDWNRPVAADALSCPVAHESLNTREAQRHHG